MSDRELLIKLPWIDFKSSGAILSSLVLEIISGEAQFFIVKGSSGSGKTRIMLEAAKQLVANEQIWVACTSAHEDRAQFEQIIYKALRETHRLENLAFSQRLELLLKQRSLHSERVVLFIDDAERLSESHLETLYQLATQKRDGMMFQVVLFADERPFNQWGEDRLATSPQYCIESLTISESERLISALSDYYGDPLKLSQQALNELHNMAYGYPGRIINELSRERLKGRYQQKRYLFVGMVLAIFVLLGSLFWFHSDSKSDYNIDGALATKVDSGKEVDRVDADGLPDLIAHLTMGDLLTPYEKIAKITPESTLPTADRSSKQAAKMYVKEDNQDNQRMNGGRAIAVKQLVVNRTADPQHEAKQGGESTQVTTERAFYIRLAKSPLKSTTERILEGRTIPGSLQILFHDDEWIALLGPYQTKKQAEEGIEHLPHSLQVLLPIVIEH